MNEQRTTFLEQRLGQSLDALAADEVPTSLTVSDLIDSGRRRARRRRARAAIELTATFVAVAALSIGVVVGTGHGGDTTDPTKFGPKPSATVKTTMGTPTDPAAPIVEFGQLPADRSGEYEVRVSAVGFNYHAPNDPKTAVPPMNGPGTSQVQVWGPSNQLLDVRLQGPGSGIEPGTTFTPAGLVQGHQAYWATGAPGSPQAERVGQLLLMWQYQPDAWANVTLANAAPSVANGETMLSVARNLKIGPVNPTALPFHLAKLPAGMTPDNVDIDLPHQHGAQTGYAALRLCIVPACSTTGQGLLISQGSTTRMSNSTLTVDGAPQLRASMAAWSKKSRAAGVAMTCTVQPRSSASFTKVPIALAGPAPHTTMDKTRPGASPVIVQTPICTANSLTSRRTPGGADTSKSPISRWTEGLACDLPCGPFPRPRAMRCKPLSCLPHWRNARAVSTSRVALRSVTVIVVGSIFLCHIDGGPQLGGG